MLYNKEEERTQLRTGLNTLLAEFDVSLQASCLKHGFNYPNMCYHLNRGNIDHDHLQSFIHCIAPDRFIQQRNGKLVIAKKF